MSVVKTVLLQSTISTTAKITLNVGHDANPLSASGTFTCLPHSDKYSSVLIVPHREKHLYIADVNFNVPGLKEGKVYNY